MAKLGKQDIALLGVIAVFALIIFGPFLLFDISQPSYDGGIYYRWAVQFDQVLRNGTLYPRWMPLANNGGGEPAFYFYSPLFFYLVAAAKSVVGDTWLAIRLVLISLSIAGGWIAYSGLRARGVQYALAALAAILLCGSPFLVSTAFTINNWPWVSAWPSAIYIILAAGRMRTGKTFIDPGLAMATCLLVLSHVLSALMVLSTLSVALVVWGACHCARGSRAHFEEAGMLLLRWGFPVALGIGMSALYLLPALGSMDLISPEGWFHEEFINWRNSFLLQVSTAPPRWPLFQFWIPGLMLLIVAASLWIRLRSGVQNRDGFTLLLLGSLVALILGSQLAYGMYAWETPIARVQLPYRFGFVISLIAPLLLCLALNRLVPSSRHRMIGLGLAALSLALTTTLVGRMVYQDDRFDPAASLTVVNGQPEYIPAGATPEARRILGTDNYAAYCHREALNCTKSVRQGDQYSVRVQSAIARTIRLPLYAFPTQTVKTNGNLAPAGSDPETGLLTVLVPAGNTTILVTHHELPIEMTAFAISLVAITLWLAAFLYRHETRLLAVTLEITAAMYPPAQHDRSIASEIATQFTKFLMVGGLATVLHYVVLFIATGVYVIDAVIGSGLGALTGALLGFILNFHYTFSSRKTYLGTSIRYLFVFAIGLTLNLFLMFVLAKIASIHYFYAQLATTSVVLIWNFFANRKWTF